MAHTFAHLITAAGHYDRSAIVKLALEIARREAAATRLQFPDYSKAQAWSFALRHGMKLAWQRAKGARLTALEAARRDAMSAADERAAALFGAAMIDDTARSFAARAAIEARFA